MRKQKYLISPDGFAFNPSGKDITINDVKKRYEKQGYYSSNYGRIPLSKLEDHCKWSDKPHSF